MRQAIIGAVVGGAFAFMVGIVAGVLADDSRPPDRRVVFFLGALLSGGGAMAGAICGAAAEILAYLKLALPVPPDTRPEDDFRELPPTEPPH
jgi:hypothetical protein